MTPETAIRRYLRSEAISEAGIEQALKDWDLLPSYIGESLFAVTMARGPEIHLLLLPEFRERGLISRGRVLRVLAPLFTKYGYLTTRIGRGDATNRLFIDRLGFKPTWSDVRFSYFMLTELPFGKGK